jgi:hypothetical protein
MLRTIVLLGLVLFGCQTITSSLEELTSEITVSPTVLAPGDTVHLLVATTNHGSEAVEAGYGCGPGLDFEITLPDGSRRYPMRELAWICPVFDSNVLEPAETDTVRFAWATPAQRGRYGVRGGIRAKDGLRAPSGTKTFEVR